MNRFIKLDNVFLNIDKTSYLIIKHIYGDTLSFDITSVEFNYKTDNVTEEEVGQIIEKYREFLECSESCIFDVEKILNEIRNQ